MKRTIAITVVAGLMFAAHAAAQSSIASNRSLAEVAKEEEARRKTIARPAKVYSNDSLRVDSRAVGTSQPSETSSNVAGGDANLAGGTANLAGAGNTSGAAADPVPTAEDKAQSGDAQGQAYWQGRIKEARDKVSRGQLFADSLQTRINSLLTDFVNRDNPVEKAKLEQDRIAALAELERVKKEIEEAQKSITAIEDEARRAGVPAGWLRPGA